MTYVSLLRLVVDFGLVILILMVQTVIYPSFSFYEKQNLVKWHKKYTFEIAILVGPLMLVQLGTAFYLLIEDLKFLNGLYVVLIAIIWIITALIFVPKHKAILREEFDRNLLASLVTYNWLRVVLWIAVFSISLAQYI